MKKTYTKLIPKAIRKALINSPVPMTSAQIAAAIAQPREELASRLYTLRKMGHIKVSGDTVNSKGRKAYLYEIVNSKSPVFGKNGEKL